MKSLLKWLLPLALIAAAIMILRKILGEQKAIDLSGAENTGPSEAEALKETELGGDLSPDLLNTGMPVGQGASDPQRGWQMAHQPPQWLPVSHS